MSGKAVKKQKLTPGGEAERLVKQCAGVLKAMQRNPAAGPFLAPVDWRALKLPTYPKMIKTPMDLGTVETKLNGGKYATVADFAADVELIFNNAKIFNTEGSDIFELADGLARDFDGRMEAVPLGPLREGGGGGGSHATQVRTMPSPIWSSSRNEPSDWSTEPAVTLPAHDEHAPARHEYGRSRPSSSACERVIAGVRGRSRIRPRGLVPSGNSPEGGAPCAPCRGCTCHPGSRSSTRRPACSA
jgi:hypothetical protein